MVCVFNTYISIFRWRLWTTADNAHKHVAHVVGWHYYCCQSSLQLSRLCTFVCNFGWLSFFIYFSVMGLCCFKSYCLFLSNIWTLLVFHFNCGFFCWTFSLSKLLCSLSVKILVQAICFIVAFVIELWIDAHAFPLDRCESFKWIVWSTVG